MSLRFLLSNGATGHYEWGSLVVFFDAPVSARTLPNVLAGFAQGVALWETAAEFRATVALMHETVHYLQDALTGVGYWDYLVRRDTTGELLTLARDLSRKPKLSAPYHPQTLDAQTASQLQSMAQKLLMESVYVPAAILPAARRTQLINSIQVCTGAELPAGEEEPFLVENLLEGEAAATVCLQIYELRGSDRQGEITTDNSSLWKPDAMAPRYRSMLEVFFDMMHRVLGEDAARSLIENNPHGYLTTICQLLIFFLDLACAHPSPGLMEERHLSKQDYDPGIKLIRLTRQFQVLSESATRQFFHAFVAGDYLKMETLLLDQCPYPYEHSSEIYQDWAELFQKMMQQDDSRALRLRAECCRNRLAHPSACATKALWGFVEHHSPIFANTPTGFRAWGGNWDFIDRTEGMTQFVDIMKENRDLALADYFFERGGYVCPAAVLGVCDAAEAICCSGITQNSQFPPAPGCFVRKGLEEAGFVL